MIHIFLAATARPIDKTIVESTIQWIAERGWHYSIANNVSIINNQLAGTDEERANALIFGLESKDVSHIWIVRGGYGTTRILDRVYKKLILTNKTIIGYSDVTALHWLLNHKNIPTIHAEMPNQFLDKTAKDPYVADSLIEVIGQKKSIITFNTTIGNSIGNATGLLVGGNLSVIYAMLLQYPITIANDFILFIEDVDEYLYHIDRMLLAIKGSLPLEKLKAIVVGGFTSMKDNEIPWGKEAEAIILEHFERMNIPIAFGFNAGHQVKNYAFYLGKKIQLLVELYKAEIAYLD